MEVVDDKRHRSVGRQLAEEVGHGVEQLTADLCPAVGAALSDGPVVSHVGGEPSQLAGGVIGEEVRQRPCRRVGEQAIQHLGEGLVGDAPIPAARPQQDRDVLPMERLCDLCGQPGLAGTRLSTEEHQLARTLTDGRPHGFHRLQLETATDERDLTGRCQLRWEWR